MFSFGNFLGMGETASAFSVQLRCFSAPFFGKYDTEKINELNYGGKILLPNSCLDNLIRRHIQWPMLFKLTNINPEHQKSTHAGVLEFLAEEGKCYLPSWMMNQMSLIEGDLIVVEYRSLPPATYAKFKPMSTDFYHVTNPKAMLEVELRKFSCLTKNDVIAVQYNEQVFEFKVMELKPQNAVTIIECDINIEFDAAEGYVEPNKEEAKAAIGQKAGVMGKRQNADSEGIVPAEADTGWKPFAGAGHRLDGKKARAPSTSNIGSPQKPLEKQSTSSHQATNLNAIEQALLAAPIVVDENYKPGELRFVRTEYKSKAVLEKMAREGADGTADGVKPFSGEGKTIRGRH